jgi:hypothetical protein
VSRNLDSKYLADQNSYKKDLEFYFKPEFMERGGDILYWLRLGFIGLSSEDYSPKNGAKIKELSLRGR